MIKFLFTTIFTVILTLTHITLAHADGPGDLDITFNGTGIVTTPIGSGVDWGTTVAVQADDKIVVGGTAEINSVNTFAVVRYNPDGSLDTGFNNTGVVTTSVGNTYGRQSIAIQPDGKIVLAGRSSGLGFSYIAVVRYDTNGNLDSTFNSTGIVTTPVNTYAGASDIAISNGRILVAGSSGNGSSYNFTTVSYDDNGNLDSSFKGSGIVTTSIGATNSEGLSMAVQSNGKVVVSGIAKTAAGGDDIAVVRYNSDGSLDHNFSGTGIVTTSIISGHAHAWGTALQSDGKIVLAGEAYETVPAHIFVIRYTVTGTLDTTFNNTGVVTTPIGTGAAAADVVIQPNNKIVVGGVADDNGKTTFALVRYNVDGNLDTTFKGTGIVTEPLGIGRAITMQSNGKLLVTGGIDTNIGVARYNGDLFYYDYLPIILKN